MTVEQAKEKIGWVLLILFVVGSRYENILAIILGTTLLVAGCYLLIFRHKIIEPEIEPEIEPDELIKIQYKSDVKRLRLGLYIIYWREGGDSLASVGQYKNGEKWFAPVNWVNVPGGDWSNVSHVKRVK